MAMQQTKRQQFTEESIDLGFLIGLKHLRIGGVITVLKVAVSFKAMASKPEKLRIAKKYNTKIMPTWAWRRAYVMVSKPKIRLF